MSFSYFCIFLLYFIFDLRMILIFLFAEKLVRIIIESIVYKFRDFSRIVAYGYLYTQSNYTSYVGEHDKISKR